MILAILLYYNSFPKILLIFQQTLVTFRIIFVLTFFLSQAEDEKEKSVVKNTTPSFDLDKLVRYMQSLPPEGLIQTSRVKLDGTDRIVLSRDSLAAWSLSSPFYGYEDTRNVWVERQNKSNGQ